MLLKEWNQSCSKRVCSILERLVSMVDLKSWNLWTVVDISLTDLKQYDCVFIGILF
jgi:hypothetical protein